MKFTVTGIEGHMETLVPSPGGISYLTVIRINVGRSTVQGQG